jgi:hypothetical protein
MSDLWVPAALRDTATVFHMRREDRAGQWIVRKLSETGRAG